MNERTLLTVHGAVNLIMGLLLVFPRPLVAVLGIPPAEPALYPSILGAVLIGIGIALWLERNDGSRPNRGLGLLGAIAINLCGSVVLGAWLLFGDLSLPFRGRLFLWALVLGLVSLSLAEWFVVLKRSDAN